MDFEFLFIAILLVIGGFGALFIFWLNDFYYCEKYKQMAKFNYFITKCYNTYSDDEFNFILNEFYLYLKKEEKKKQKIFEKRIKQDFKKNIKSSIDNIF